jgi:hypothetical protein
MILHLWGIGVNFVGVWFAPNFMGLYHSNLFLLLLLRFVWCDMLCSLISWTPSPLLFQVHFSSHFLFCMRCLCKLITRAFWFDFLKLQVQYQMIVWQTVWGKYYIVVSSFPFFALFSFLLWSKFND